MMTVRRIYLGLAVILQLTLISNFTFAAQAGNSSTLQTMQGKIDSIDVNKNRVIVDDMSYTIGSDVVVKTVAGNIGRLGQLYPGKRIRMEVEFRDSQPGIIQTIYILR